MKHSWTEDNDAQCFNFDYNFFNGIKVTLDLQSSSDVKWKIIARSKLKVMLAARYLLVLGLYIYKTAEV